MSYEVLGSESNLDEAHQNFVAALPPKFRPVCERYYDKLELLYGKASPESIHVGDVLYQQDVAAPLIERYLRPELLSLKGVGDERARALLTNSLVYKPFQLWPHQLQIVMTRPEVFWKNRKPFAQSAEVRNDLGTIVFATSFSRESIKSIRDWAAPWYQAK